MIGERTRSMAAAAILAGLVAIVYGRAVGAGFVFDDQNVYSHRAVPGLRFIMRIV